jgi:hypothetical protein
MGDSGDREAEALAVALELVRFPFWLAIDCSNIFRLIAPWIITLADADIGLFHVVDHAPAYCAFAALAAGKRKMQASNTVCCFIRRLPPHGECPDLAVLTYFWLFDVTVSSVSTHPG